MIKKTISKTSLRITISISFFIYQKLWMKIKRLQAAHQSLIFELIELIIINQLNSIINLSKSLFLAYLSHWGELIMIIISFKCEWNLYHNLLNDFDHWMGKKSTEMDLKSDAWWFEFEEGLSTNVP